MATSLHLHGSAGTDPVAAVPGGAEYSCLACGYGAIAHVLPSGCPMCGGTAWKYGRPAETGRPVVERRGRALFLVTPPRSLDAGAGAALTELVAALAAERPELVLDLADTALEAPTMQLLLRLAALVRGAGGRLLAICPTSRGEAVELHELAAAAVDRPGRTRT